MTIAAVVLAAGSSRRLGRSKQLLRYQGEPLVVRTARIAAEAGLTPVFVIVRTGSELCELIEASGYQCVENPQAEEGMASSIRVGTAAAIQAGAEGIVMLACDQPYLDTEHIAQLIAEPLNVTASAYRGIRGVPAYFPASTFDRLAKFQGDVGARELLRTARTVPNEKLNFDVDTPADAQKLEE